MLDGEVDRKKVSLTIRGTPVPKGKPRIGRRGKGKLPMLYAASSTVQWQGKVEQQAREQYSGPLLKGPLFLRATFHLSRPGRLIWKRRPMPSVLHDTQGDLDHFIEAIADPLQGIVYENDKQIAVVLAAKWYCAGPEIGWSQPHVYLHIEEVGGLSATAILLRPFASNKKGGPIV